MCIEKVVWCTYYEYMIKIHSGCREQSFLKPTPAITHEPYSILNELKEKTSFYRIRIKIFYIRIFFYSGNKISISSFTCLYEK